MEEEKSSKTRRLEGCGCDELVGFVSAMKSLGVTKLNIEDKFLEGYNPLVKLTIIDDNTIEVEILEEPKDESN